MPCADEFRNDGNYIVEAVKSIDRLQKERYINKCSGCITCENAFLQNTFNTIPISLYCCGGGRFLVATTPDGEITTGLFRVECVRNDRYATLRLITVAGATFTCLDQTVTVDLESFNGIECFSPIICPSCNVTEVE